MSCTPGDIFSLHLGKVKSFLDVVALITPFFNEFANLFTITIFLPYFGYSLYPEHNCYKKMLIDFIALFGIILNVAIENDKMAGVIKGLAYLLFAFVIPNLFMADYLDIFYKKNYALKFIAGIFLIYILELCIQSVMCFYRGLIKNKSTTSPFQ